MESEWLQVSKILLSILADFYDAVVWMVPIFPLVSCSSSLFSMPLGTVPRALTTVGITDTFKFRKIFCSLAKSKYLSCFLPSFSFIFSTLSRFMYLSIFLLSVISLLRSAQMAKSANWDILFFLFVIIIFILHPGESSPKR